MLKQRQGSVYLGRIILWLLIFLFPSPAWAAIPNGGGGACIPSGKVTDLMEPFRCMFGNLATFLITAAPIIAAILLAFGGLRYMASAGDERALQSTKQFITWVILGFLAALGAVFIFRLIMTILRGDPGVLPFL